MKKTFLISMALLLASAVFAQTGNVYHEIQIVDELGRKVTDATNLYIYAPATTTDAVIYADRRLQNVITLPMTAASANTTLVNGYASWYGPDGYDFSVSNANAVGPLTNSGHILRSSSEGQLVFPSYLTSLTTTAWLDAESISMGTGAEWVINGGGVADTLRITPAADNSAVTVGTNGATNNTDLNWYVNTDLGLFIDAGVPSLIWNGGDTSFNLNVAGVMNINTGTATGAVNIGCATAGIITVDTDESIGINADLGITVTNTTAASDQIYTTAGSFQVIAQEAANLAAVNIDITGAVSGFDLDTTNGPIVMTAANATNGDVTIEAGDIMTLTSVDTKIYDGAAAETWIIEGTANAHEATVVFTDPTADVTWTFPTGGADTLYLMGSTFLANYPEVAGSVWGAENSIVFEGATANASDLRLQAFDVTAAVVYEFPDAAAATYGIMPSTLAANGVDVTNSVTGGTNQLVFEGAGVDDHEIRLTAADATADVLYTLPDAAAATYGIVVSSLAANGVDIVNSVTGGTNQLIFEGTADALETILQANDATVADATIELPNDSGDIAYCPAGVVDYAAGAGALPITHTIITYESIGGAEGLTLADGQPGQILQVNHDTDGGNGVITPATALGYTSVDLADDGDMVTFLFVDTQGWIIIGTAGNAAPPVVTP